MKKKLLILSIMRISFTQMMLAMFFAGLTYATKAPGQELLEKPLTIQLREKPLKSVLLAIESQISVKFIYSSKAIRTERRTTLNIQNQTLKNVLETVLKPMNINYRVSGNQIVLSQHMPESMPPVLNKAEEESPGGGLPNVNASTAELMIGGKVTNDKGEALPGVSILVKGTQQGATSDVDGKFSLTVGGSDAVLVFSFVGYISQEIVVGNRTKMEVFLKVDEKILDEVVVVGFGTQKKQSVVGSIVQTTNEQLKRAGNVTDLKQALTGQLPGLTTVTSSGEPGGSANGESATQIFIRGRNTWNGGQPLIMVDGVERAMENIDVSEVATISVLKDASATAVFGVKGANGVILITTKRGSASKPQLSVTYNATALTVSRLPEKLDSYDAIMLRNEMIEREGLLSPVL